MDFEEFLQLDASLEEHMNSLYKLERSRRFPPPVCECGAEKLGLQYHAYWCVMWKDPMDDKEPKK